MMIPSMMLCIDPGLVTGLGVLYHNANTNEIGKIISLEDDLPTIGEYAEEFMIKHTPSEAEVVVERFIITVRTAKNSQAPWSLETIGMMRWLVCKHWKVDADDALVLQQPADAKGLVGNDLLRKMGIWHRGGAGHANDALRHGVYRYARLGVRDMFTS